MRSSEAPTKHLSTVGKFVPQLLERIGITAEKFSVATIIEREVAQSSPTARIVGFKDNKVYVEVESSAELQELYFRKREISKVVRGSLPRGSNVSEPEIKFFIRGMAKMQPVKNTLAALKK